MIITVIQKKLNVILNEVKDLIEKQCISMFIL